MEGSEFKDRAARGGEGWEGQNYRQEENPLDEYDNFYDENEDCYGGDLDDSFGSSDPNDSTSAVSTNPSQDTNNSENRTDPTVIGDVRNQENSGAMQVNASDKDDKLQWSKYNMTQDVKSDNSILSDSINHGNDKSHLPTGIVRSNRSFQETNDFAKSMGITSDLSDNMFRQTGFSEAIDTLRTSDKPGYPPYYMDSEKISRHGASNINSFNNQSHNNKTGVLRERMDESDAQQGVTDNVKSFSGGLTSDSVNKLFEENKDFQEEMDTEDQDLPLEDAGDFPEDAGEFPEGAGEIAEGAGEFPEGAGEFPEDAGEFPEGAGEFPEGAGEIAEGGEFPDDLIDDEGVTETPSESVGLPDELTDAVLDEEVDKDAVDDADYEEEGSEEEESEESDDEDFNDAMNAIGDLENEDFLNEEEGEGGLEEEVVDNQEVPDTSQSAEGTSEERKKKRKRRKKGEAADEDGKKPKKKRKKKGEKSEDGEKKGDKNARRNIRKILTESNLEKETLDAQNAELERQRRLADLKKVMPTQVAAVVKPSPEKDTTKEKDSQLKSLLQAAEETAEKETDKKEAEKDKLKEEKKDVKTKKEGIIDISSGEEDEDCVMVRSEDEEEEDLSDEDYAEAEDVNNSGSHINDMYNVRDKEGRVLVNVGHPTSDPDIYLSPLVGQNIKPHQIGGVRFMYDNLVECINRFKTSNGFGCILAHSMGLGKTIQVVGFTDIFLRHTGARTVLVIVPINTLANWMAEFNMWVPDEQTCKQHENNLPPGMTGRPYPIYLLNDNFKNTPARAKVVDAWAKSGGVLLIGYEMYRLLSSKKVHLQKTNKGRKKTPESAVIDVEEEDRDRKLLAGVHEALVNPGPDLVVCDEGHRIKNSHAGISQSLKQIKTKRRIVLTGYPLQNNLIEYWCMVDFVRPNFLGTKTEFCNMFERPIMNGQCADSTPQDVRLMRYRAHVLHSLLEGFVQRRGHTVLQAALPPKEEYVFMIRMSPIQKQLYEKFMESITESGQNGWVNNNPLKAFSVCCKIWNHPDILYTILKKSLDDNDLDIETGEPKKKGRGRAKKETPPATPAPPTPSMDSDGSNSASNPGSGPPTLAPGIPVTVPGIPSTVVPNPGPSQGPILSFGRYSEPNITYDWANEIMKDYVPGMLESGGKMVMLFKILQESLAVGDKILVFSQSLFTLNLVEDFLSKQKVPRYDTDEFWCKNKNYFRLDGSTSSTEREKLINQFNCDNTTWLFLLSTRAGSLGVNLIGANRVIVLDASWNPCHDCQAICRVYRFGQIKPSFIYRFVTENTMERKIYDRQVNKQGMSDRVVDELNPQSQFKKDHVEKLMVYADKEYEVQDFSKVEDEHFDPVMISTLKDQGHWLTCRPFTHESLLIDRKELKLTMKEKRLAKQSYVMEKRLNVSYSRPSYAAYYPKGQQPYQGGMRGRGMPARPIASVKPMISTPVPMKPKIVAAPQVLKPGVSVHQVLTTTDITLPGTNTTTEAGAVVPKKIPAGQNVLVIRTPKGVYIRTPDGKIFAVRSKPQPDSTSPLDTLANTGSTLALTATSGNSTTVTVVQAATNSTTSSTTTVRTPVTVIRPGGGVSSTKPLTIIRQGPGPIRTVIPVTIGSKSGGAANASVTAKLMSQKVNTMIKNGTQIKIVNPSLLAGGKAGSTSSLTVGKKVIANSMSLSGGKVVSTTTASRPIAAVKTIDKDEAKMEVKPAPATMTTTDTGKKDEQKKQNDTDSSWNLPPIDMQALKIPKQLNEAGFQQSKNKDSVTSVVKSVHPSKPAVSATQDGGPAKLSTRPSDIDLHELQLSNNPVTNTNTQIPNFQKSSQSAAMFTNTNTFMSQPPSYPGNQQGMMGQNNNNMPNNNNMASQQQMSGFTPDNTVSGQQQPVNTSTSINMSQTGTSNNFLQNQSSYGGMGDYSNQTGNQSNFNNMSNFTSNNQYGGNTSSMESQNYGGFNSSFTGTGSQGYSNNSSDNNSDFNNIHNNSSFLSELNFTDNDDNFLAQLSGNDTTTQNQAAGQTSNLFMNNQNFSTGSTTGGSSSMSSGSGSMGGGSGTMGGGSMSMQGMQQSQPTQQQQQNMNYDNMYSSTQQNQGMFPRFGNNQFLGNQSFGNNQSFTQQGYPGGSMYPMGGMMQPAMYGYAPFAPYPYPPMMAPMPYYHPMPFQPQYGMQNSMGNTSIGASNMGNSNMAATNMGNASMGTSSVGNTNMVNSSMGATNFDNKTNPLGGFTMNMGQGDNSFQQNQQTSNN